MSTVIALYEYQGATEEELCFSAGEKFALLNKENEDWWFVRNREDIEGYVPSTYFKLGSNSVSDSNSDESEMESQESFIEAEEAESESEDETKNPQQAEELDSEDENQEVSEVLEKLKKRPRTPKPSPGVKLLSPEPLEGFSGMALGYRHSTLAKNYNSGIGRTADSLIPEVGASGIDFKELFLDKNGHVRKMQVLN
jgi:hypothetical protein